MITALNKKLSPESFWVLKISSIKKNRDIHKMKESKKKRYQHFSRKFKKWKIYFWPLVLAAMKCYFGDNGHKMETSFKTLVSKNAATKLL